MILISIIQRIPLRPPKFDSISLELMLEMRNCATTSFLLLVMMESFIRASNSYVTDSWQASIKVDPATLPTFLTSSQVFKVTENDTVVLPCEVSNPGPYVLVWKKGITVLSAGNVKVSLDPRVNLVNGYSLEIKEVTPQDAGDYVCQIGTLEPREITHTIDIQEENPADSMHVNGSERFIALRPEIVLVFVMSMFL